MSSTTSPTTRRAIATGTRYTGNDPGFGHAYYLDGAFKNYHFNNIAWGKSKDAASPLANCSAFQEIISYQNTFFQNTVYNFYEGSRRQAPAAGRNKYLGNIWDGMGKYVFRHADPARTKAEGNARDAGPRRGHFALETNAYARNVFHDFAEMGILEPSGRWLLTFDDFKGRLAEEPGPALRVGRSQQDLAAPRPRQGRLPPGPGRRRHRQGRQGVCALVALRRGGRVELLSRRQRPNPISSTSTGT